MKITNEMVKQAYRYGKKVYLGELSRNQAKFEISSVSGMDVGSAQDYVTVLLGMMQGEEYHRTVNAYATRYFLDSIKEDFGIEALKKAVSAADQHAKYYKTLGRGNLTSIENIVKEYKEQYALYSDDTML